MKILQWNIRSVLANNIIAEVNPTLKFLQETFLQPNLNFKILHYTPVRADRQLGYGGVAVLVHESVPYKTIQIPNIPPKSFQIQIQTI